MIDIESIVPGGILCLWSAWSIHGLTTSLPQAFHIAIKRDRKVTTPSFPPIEVHHYTPKVLEVGISEMVIDGFRINIYDIERCVCDAVNSAIKSAWMYALKSSTIIWSVRNETSAN